ncbi:MAG: tetratricopeptide repeat protein [Proteobacteria bacterium]|nr:MAG: tetratricopeptide repeat protein [Pseudomonadota bacterium]
MNALSAPGDSSRLTRLLGYLEQDPANVALLHDASDLALQEGCWDEARTLVANMLALSPLDPVSRYRKAVILTHDGDAPASLALTQALLDDGVQNDAVLFQHARALILTGRHADAEPVLEGLLPRADNLPEFPYLYVRALHGAGRIKDAIQVAAGLGAEPLAQGMLSLLYTDDDNLQEGAGLAAAVLATHPDNIDALISAGTASLAMEEVDAALPYFKHAIEQHPHSGRAWMGLGLARLSSQDFAAARAAFEQTVTLMPAHLGSWNTLAWIQILQNDHAAADATLQAALRINHNFGETHGTIAVLRAFEQRWDEAKQHADVAVRLQPDSFAGRFAQTLILEHRGQPDKARQLLENVMRNFRAPAGGNLGDVVRRHAIRNPAHRSNPSSASKPDKEAT